MTDEELDLVDVADGLDEVLDFLVKSIVNGFRESEEEQIMKGKLNNLLKNNVWTKILDMKNSEISDSKLYSSLNQ